ncbi:hypothetical protein GZ212_03550 [Mangrovimonas sp. CR14]|uniref:hypothetical protein n=1 Tax=Mangrovimonas sp. CR14 TaxID=2706120 RepID=UPI0014220617|nr:hypothetical protein [Mangrovimonas sp. CR14]NIK91217.1 hypothetical protein [Mangrovimonas sp. CR14]
MKNFKLLTLLLVSALFSVSCIVDDEDETLDAMANTPYVVGFKTASFTESYFSDEGPIESYYPLNLIGGMDGTPSASNIVVNYSVNPASSATEGVEFDFMDNSGTMTIPAGQRFDEFGIYINTGNLNPTEPTRLILDLEGVASNNATISSFNTTLTITFVGCQSELGGQNYLVTGTRSDGASFSMGVEPLEEVGVNTFHTLTTGHWAAGSLQPDHGFSFVDVCGELSILPDQYLMNAYSNTWGGVQYPDASSGAHGVVDENGNFTIIYSIVLSGTNYIYTMTYTLQ